MNIFVHLGIMYTWFWNEHIHSFRNHGLLVLKWIYSFISYSRFTGFEMNIFIHSVITVYWFWNEYIHSFRYHGLMDLKWIIKKTIKHRRKTRVKITIRRNIKIFRKRIEVTTKSVKMEKWKISLIGISGKLQKIKNMTFCLDVS